MLPHYSVILRELFTKLHKNVEAVVGSTKKISHKTYVGAV
jgi:hypothetical protein